MTPDQPVTGLPAGTPVLTPAGERPVETLRPGDFVIAVSGAAAPFQPVVGIRHRPVAGAMVRIRAGALAEGSPQLDLLLPTAHRLLVDGVLLAAGALADGRGVLHEPDAGAGVFEVVLAAHDALLAAGSAVESGLPDPDAPLCCPRAEPDGTLRALLDWRAETMGWAPAPEIPEPPPVVGSLRLRLASSPLVPLHPPEPRFTPGR